MTTTLNTDTTAILAELKEAQTLDKTAKKACIRALNKQYGLKLAVVDAFIDQDIANKIDELELELDSPAGADDIITTDEIEEARDQFEQTVSAGADQVAVEPAAVIYPIPTGYLSGNKAEIMQIDADTYSDGIQPFTADQFKMALSLNFLTPVTAVKKSEIVKPVEVKPTKYVMVCELYFEFESLDDALECQNLSRQNALDFLTRQGLNSSAISDCTFSVKKTRSGRAPRTNNTINYKTDEEKANYGVKGDKKERVIAWGRKGFTLLDLMNDELLQMSEKNARNHLSYIKNWGYKLERYTNNDGFTAYRIID